MSQTNGVVDKDEVLDVNSVSKNVQKSEKDFLCRRCDTYHGRKSCPTFEACLNCNRKGHVAAKCRSKNKNKTKRVNTVDLCDSVSKMELYVDSVTQKADENVDWFETKKIGTKFLKVKLDTGAMQCYYRKHREKR